MRILEQSTLRYLSAVAIVSTGLVFLWQFSVQAEKPLTLRVHSTNQSSAFSQIPAVSCSGPSGDPALSLLGDELDGVSIPPPTYGSFEALDLPETWMTFDQRYGRYGYDNETLSDALRKADWGRLQNECFERNRGRFPGQKAVSTLPPRFRLFNKQTTEHPPPVTKTNRQAIVIRTWSTYNYQDEDLWNLRSIITEASLATGAKYQVFLLVDVKEKESRIHEDDNEYERVLRESVPEEFRSMTVLWHTTLLKSWYKKVLEHRSAFDLRQTETSLG